MKTEALCVHEGGGGGKREAGPPDWEVEDGVGRKLTQETGTGRLKASAALRLLTRILQGYLVMSAVPQ